MKIKQLMLVVLFLSITFSVNAQSDFEKINNTLLDYIEGTANGQPDRLKRAFHPDFNLYFVANDTIRVWKGEKYIANVKEGRKSNRIGKVISVDYEGNAASAKIEILMPSRKRIYTDYLLLLKVKDNWKIIQKSFTYKNYPK